MKNPRAIGMIVVSVVLGLVAVVMASQWINKQANISAQKVVVAAVDVDLGSKLAPEMLRTVDWPSGSIPNGAILDPKELDGRVLKTSVLRGEAILESKLAPVGTKGGLSAVVMEGKRAMTVRVNDVVGVAGFALPGNYVDILVNTTDDAKKNQNNDASISKIVLEHILVLAVAQEASRDDTKPKVVNAVTLEVTPEQAEKLDLARSVGTLSLVLRNQVDPQPVQTAGITKQTLLRGHDEPAPPKVAATESKPVKKHVKATKKTVKATHPATSVAAAQTCVDIVRGASRHRECF